MDRNTSLVDVVIDPDLSGLMRAHQKEGVKVSQTGQLQSYGLSQFMYSCVMGMTEAEGEGCILADEMGLGKTLSAIALVYTMLSTSTSTGGSTANYSGQSPFKKDTAW
jgi:DNA repair and recombination protein RAD54B